MRALITGATSGIGKSFAESLAQSGYDLLLTGRRAELLQNVAASIHDTCGVEVQTIVGDLTDDEVGSRVLDSIGSVPVDVLVNNAGSGLASDYAVTNPEKIEQLLAILAAIPGRLISAVLPHMVETGAGTIINVGSLAGRVAVPGSSVYVAAKAYIERLSESLALELYGSGVVVQALIPGYVRTDFHRAIPDYKEKQKSRGAIRWLEAEQVVRISMAAANRARLHLARGNSVPRSSDVVVIPGFMNRVLNGLSRILPRRLVYFAAARRHRLQ